MKLSKEKLKKFGLIGIVILILVGRILFVKNISSFYISNLQLDDGLMVSQMMSLSKR